MPTYIYESIPNDTSRQPRRFEIIQKMSDDALTTDPETGDPVRRVITGGLGLKMPHMKRSTVVNKNSAAATACGCATGKPHKHHSHKHGSSCGHKH